MEGKDAAKFRFPQSSLLDCWYFKYCCVLLSSFLFSCHNSSSVTSPWVWKERNTEMVLYKTFTTVPNELYGINCWVCLRAWRAVPPTPRNPGWWANGGYCCFYFRKFFFLDAHLEGYWFWIFMPSQMPGYCSIMWQAPGMRYCTGLTRFLPQGNCIAVEGGREWTEDILSETDSCRKGTIHQECPLMKMDSLYWDIRVETGPWGRKELKGSRMVEANVAGSQEPSKEGQPRKALVSKKLQSEFLLPVSSDTAGGCGQRWTWSPVWRMGLGG